MLPAWATRGSTLVVVAVLGATGVAAAVMRGPAGPGDALRAGDAARVDGAAIARGDVLREVAAIKDQAAYAAYLGHATTGASGALSPLALGGGEPEDALQRVPSQGVAPTAAARPFGDEDLQAAVLTRLIYLRIVEEQLQARHVSVTAADTASAAEVAGATSGVDAAGAPLFDQLPGWYHSELVRRGAEAGALQAALGVPPPDDAAVAAAYDGLMASRFTDLCLTQVVLAAPADGAAARARLAAGAPPAKVGTAEQVGCHPLSSLPSDVAEAVHDLDRGQVSAPVIGGARTAVFVITARTVRPLSAARGEVLATLQAKGSAALSRVIQDRLAVARVRVAYDYGTFARTGPQIGVVPRSSLPVTGGRTSGDSGPQRSEPFD